MHKHKALSAFTIVELLIVIVVIGVLATITTVSFSGITSQTGIATIQSDLSSNGRKMQLYFTQYGSYPTALDGSNCPTAPILDNNYCIKLTSGNSINSYTGTLNDFTLIISRGSTTYQIKPGTSPSLIVFGPTISSIYSGYDLLFCRYATNCSGVSGISSDFSYQVAFTAKAGSKYSVNMIQIDNTSTNWTSGTTITSNISYATPTAGASLSSNIITTTNAGETRVTFTGTGLQNKTLISRITEVDNSNSAISQSSHTKALGVYTTIGSYTLDSPATTTFTYMIVAGGGGSGIQSNGGEYVSSGGAGGLVTSTSASLTSGGKSIVVGAGGARGANGGNSSLTGFTTAVGGGKGAGTASGGVGGNGGSGGGGWGSGIAGQGHNGGALGGDGSNVAGGGGGAGGPGGTGPGPTSTPGVAGSGLALTITGTSVVYAKGGGAYNSQPASAYGGGGDGNQGWGLDGQSGIVILRTL